MRWSMITECGPVRSTNEDSLCVCPELGLFAVADGMGGHKAGEVASRLALDKLVSFLKQNWDYGITQNLLADAVQAANRAVFQNAAENPDRQGMGTTITACMFRNRLLWVANVGDSRALLLRKGKLSKLTSDHSLVQELVDGGGITEADALNHPRRNVLTRALGVGPQVEADIFEYRIFPGDRLLICTDGLCAFVDERRIGEMMGLPREPEEVVRLLLAEALNRSNDNITMIFLAVD